MIQSVLQKEVPSLPLMLEDAISNGSDELTPEAFVGVNESDDRSSRYRSVRGKNHSRELRSIAFLQQQFVAGLEKCGQCGRIRYRWN